MLVENINSDIHLYAPQIIDDDEVENLEHFEVGLAYPSNNATIGSRSTVNITIADDYSKN